MELLRDTELNIFRRRHIEVTEELDVLEDGTQPESDGLSEELVTTDTITELNSTRRSTESEREKLREPATTPPLLTILPKKISLLWEDSSITEESNRTSS